MLAKHLRAYGSPQALAFNVLFKPDALGSKDDVSVERVVVAGPAERGDSGNTTPWQREHGPRRNTGTQEHRNAGTREHGKPVTQHRSV